MTNLTEQDLNRIEAIVEAKLKHYNLIEPIDTTEGEYTFIVKPVSTERLIYGTDTVKLAPIETEQPVEKYIVESYQYSGLPYYYIHIDVAIGNLNEEKALQLQEAIKQYLSSNKF